MEDNPQPLQQPIARKAPTPKTRCELMYRGEIIGALQTLRGRNPSYQLRNAIRSYASILNPQQKDQFYAQVSRYWNPNSSIQVQDTGVSEDSVVTEEPQPQQVAPPASFAQMRPTNSIYSQIYPQQHTQNTSLGIQYLKPEMISGALQIKQSDAPIATLKGKYGGKSGKKPIKRKPGVKVKKSIFYGL
jgi:hypothetical protein